MTTIPTLDKISGNTVMQKFRSLAKAVIDTLTSFGEETDYIITDLAPRLESNLDVLTAKLLELSSGLETMQELQTTVSDLASRVNATLDVMVTTNTIQNITALKTFSGGLAVVGSTNIDGEVQITNGHDLAVAGDIDCANGVYTDGLTVREQAEISGMAIEPSGTKTVLSNDNGIVVTGGLDTDVPTTTTGVRDTKAANGSRIQNDLDAYEHMVRTSGNFVLNGRISLLQDSLVPITNLNGISKGFLRLSHYVSAPHSAAFIMTFRGGCAMVSFTTNSDNTAINKCDVYGSSINNLGLVVAKDDTGIYLGFSGVTSNVVVTITNMVLYRSGFISIPTEVDIDISNMTKVQVVPT